jgi:uncharacterized repeat protein (TIGR01451 family)
MLLRYTAFSAVILLFAASVFGVSVNISGQLLSPCGQARGELQANASGGTLPYTYSWSNGATTPSITNLPPGTYTVTVTDNLGAQASATQEITNVTEYPTLNPVVSLTYCAAGSPYAIFPINDPTFLSPTEPTTFFGGVVDQFVSQSGSLWVMELEGGPGTYPIIYTDAFGCTGMINWVVNDPVLLPTITVSGITGSCSDGAAGSALVTVPSVTGENDLSLTIKDATGNTLDATPCLGENPGGWSGAYVVLDQLAPGSYWAVLDVDEYCLFGTLPDFLAPCADSVQFIVPDLGVTCGTVQGSAWYDVNEDCVFDAEDVGVPYSPLSIEPGGYIAMTDADGTYLFELVDGNYTIAPLDPTLVPYCPAVQPVAFAVNDDATTIEFANGSTQPLDLRVVMNASVARPGFEQLMYTTVRNLSPQLSGPVTLTITLDPTLVFSTASVAPTSIAGNVLTWQLPAFGPYEQLQVTVSANVPAATSLGTALTHSAVIANTLTEATLTNNTSQEEVSVTGSFDPNDKTARTSSGWSDSLYYIDVDTWVDYTIRFQNTGTDTAFTVVVTDTIPAELDLASFEPGTASHPFSLSFKPGRVVQWRFADILLPDSNVNEGESHGLVSFRIRPRLPLVPGTTIENVANIYFDFNEPVITEPSVLLAEFSTGLTDTPGPTGALSVYPNPTKDMVTVRLDQSAHQRLVLTALDGRMVAGIPCSGTIASFDIGDVSPGSYTLVVHAADGRSLRTSLLKQ